MNAPVYDGEGVGVGLFVGLTEIDGVLVGLTDIVGVLVGLTDIVGVLVGVGVGLTNGLLQQLLQIFVNVYAEFGYCGGNTTLPCCAQILIVVGTL